MNTEAIELLEKGLGEEICINYVRTGCPCCARFKKLINQALALLAAKPEAGEFTKNLRGLVERREYVSDAHILQALARLDAAEQENKKLRQGIINDNDNPVVLVPKEKYEQLEKDFAHEVDMAAQANVACIQQAKKIHELEAEVEQLKPFEKAIKDRHNSYNPDIDCPEPETPAKALDELLSEAEMLGCSEREKRLEAEIKGQQQIIDDYSKIINDQDEVYEEKKELEAEKKRLQKAIQIADNDRQKAWRTLEVVEEALKDGK